MATSTLGALGDYTTGGAWEVATDNDLVTAAEGERLEVLDETVTSPSFLISGATYNSTYYRSIGASSGAGAYSVSADTGPKMINDNTFSGTTIIIAENMFTLEDICVEATGNNSALQTSPEANSVDSELVVRRCAIEGNNDFVLSNFAGNVNATACDRYILTCELFDRDATGGYRLLAFNVDVASGCLLVVEGNTAWGANLNDGSTTCNAVYNNGGTNSGTVYFRNNCAFGTTFGADFAFSSISGTSTLSNNASEDSTAPGTSAVTGLTSADFTDTSTDDYSPASGSDLIDAGYNASSVYTVDIEGTTITGTYEIGAYNFAGTSGVTMNGTVIDETATVNSGTFDAGGSAVNMAGSVIDATATPSAGALGIGLGSAATDSSAQVNAGTLVANTAWTGTTIDETATVNAGSLAIGSSPTARKDTRTFLISRSQRNDFRVTRVSRRNFRI